MRARLRPDQEDVGARRVLRGGEPVEAEAVALGLGLRQAAPRRRGEQLAASHGGEHARPLVGRPEPRDGVGGRRVRDEDRGERRRAPRELLDQHRVGPEVEAEPAVALGHERAEDAELAKGVDELSRPGAGRVERLDHGHDLLLHELADGEDQLAPLGRLALPRDEGAQPLAVPLDEAPRDDRALDLVGALADEHERRVPVIPLEVEVDADARRAEGSERRQRDLVRGLGGVELRHAGLEVAALAAVLQAGRPVGEQAGGPHLRRHVGELRPYVDRAGGVAERVLVCGLRDAHRPRGDVEPPGLEPAHHVLEAAALDAAHEVLGRHDDVLEEELRRVHSLVAELRDGLHDLEPGVVLLDDEARHALVAWFGLRVGEGEIGRAHGVDEGAGGALRR